MFQKEITRETQLLGFDTLSHQQLLFPEPVEGKNGFDTLSYRPLSLSKEETTYFLISTDT